MGWIFFYTFMGCFFLVLAIVLAWKKHWALIFCLFYGLFFLLGMAFIEVPKRIPNGMPSTSSIRASEYPGIRHEVLKVVGEFDSKNKVEVIILSEKREREYRTISRDKIVNKEIPLDAKELTAIYTVKGVRIIMGPFETFDLEGASIKTVESMAAMLEDVVKTMLYDVATSPQIDVSQSMDDRKFF